MHQELPQLRETFEQLYPLSGSALSEEGSVLVFFCLHTLETNDDNRFGIA